MTTSMNDKIKRMTSKKCEEWALNPTINPLSGASIDPAAPTGVYRKNSRAMRYIRHYTQQCPLTSATSTEDGRGLSRPAKRG